MMMKGPSRAKQRRTGLGGLVYGTVESLGRSVRTRWFPSRQRQPLYRGSALDDILFGQPVNLPLRLLRRLLGPRRMSVDGVSVIVVNFNSLDLLRDVLPAVRRFSPADTEIIVIDNSSRDGSWHWLKRRPFGILPVRIPVNVGHGRALDLGLLLARSPVVVTLDSDAFPFSSAWLDRLLAPLLDPDIAAAGTTGPRDRLHPACAAYRRAAVLATGLSFHNFNLHRDLGEPPLFGINTWDTAELVFEALGREHVALLPVREYPSGGGLTIDGVVYHHTAATTSLTDDPEAVRAEKRRMWAEAVADLLPAT